MQTNNLLFQNKFDSLKNRFARICFYKDLILIKVLCLANLFSKIFEV